MKSRLTPRFRKALTQLPDDVRAQANSAYRLFRANPYHASLQFKLVGQKDPIYSVRVGESYRALGRREADDLIVWF